VAGSGHRRTPRWRPVRPRAGSLIAPPAEAGPDAAGPRGRGVTARSWMNARILVEPFQRHRIARAVAGQPQLSGSLCLCDGHLIVDLKARVGPSRLPRGDSFGGLSAQQPLVNEPLQHGPAKGLGQNLRVVEGQLEKPPVPACAGSVNDRPPEAVLGFEPLLVHGTESRGRGTMALQQPVEGGTLRSPRPIDAGQPAGSADCGLLNRSNGSPGVEPRGDRLRLANPSLLPPSRPSGRVWNKDSVLLALGFNQAAPVATIRAIIARGRYPRGFGRALLGIVHTLPSSVLHGKLR